MPLPTAASLLAPSLALVRAGTVCTLISGLAVTTIEFHANMDLAAELMDVHAFPPKLRTRINKYCLIKHEAQGSNQKLMNTVFGMLSLPTKRLVMHHIHGPNLRRNKLFMTA